MMLQEQLDELDQFVHNRSKAIQILQDVCGAELDANGHGFFQECEFVLQCIHFKAQLSRMRLLSPSTRNASCGI
jgi:hypothetical protein